MNSPFAIRKSTEKVHLVVELNDEISCFIIPSLIQQAFEEKKRKTDRQPDKQTV